MHRLYSASFLAEKADVICEKPLLLLSDSERRNPGEEIDGELHEQKEIEHEIHERI